jgi:hypothetical protein
MEAGAQQHRGMWTYTPSPAEQEAVMEQWAQRMRETLYIGTTARAEMARRGITPTVLRCLPVNAPWAALFHLMLSRVAPIHVRNSPPLKRGDYVEIQAGNHVQWESVGKRGTLVEYFRDNDHWGVDMELGDPGLTMAANLKRITRAS